MCRKFIIKMIKLPLAAGFLRISWKIPISIDVGEMCTIQLIELINHLFQSTVEHGARVVDPVDASDTVVAELG